MAVALLALASASFAPPSLSLAPSPAVALRAAEPLMATKNPTSGVRAAPGTRRQFFFKALRPLTPPPALLFSPPSAS